jgi:hypothetical protein
MFVSERKRGPQVSNELELFVFSCLCDGFVAVDGRGTLGIHAGQITTLGGKVS